MLQYTEEQKKFILENDGKMPRKEIQKRLGVGIHVVTGWCIELKGRKRGLVNKRKPPRPVNSEFFEHDYSIATI